MNNLTKIFVSVIAYTCLNLPTYVLLAREKSSATKDIMNSVLVALLILLAANNNLSFSPSAVNLIILVNITFLFIKIFEENFMWWVI